MNAPLQFLRYKPKYAEYPVLLSALLCSAIFYSPAFAQTAGAPTASEKSAAPAEPVIQFSADNVDYDSNADLVTAIGDVVLNRDGYSLRADTIIWNRKSGEVTAQGNIRSVGPNGDAAYGDSIQLTDTLKDGVIERGPTVQLISILPHIHPARLNAPMAAPNAPAGKSKRLKSIMTR
jgi:lipopolysaccharide assembly outer membrane protein LptD (OstA)